MEIKCIYYSVSNNNKKKERPKPKKYTHIINTECTLKMRAVSGPSQLRGEGAESRWFNIRLH